MELKPTGKRSNRIVFFDDECPQDMRFLMGEQAALFISGMGTAALRVGLHDHASAKLEDKFGPHCCRHWFNTHLRRPGMPREFIQEVRGDIKKEAIDIYDYICR